MVCNILAFYSSTMPSSEEEISLLCQKGERVLRDCQRF